MMIWPTSILMTQGRRREAGISLAWVALILAGLLIGVPILLNLGNSPPSQTGIDVRNIVNAQETFFAGVGQGRYADSLPELLEASLIEVQLGSEKKAGYVFTSVSDDDGKSFTVTARPEAYGTTGKHSFFANQTGVVYYTDQPRSANSNDPVL
ncbi:MAG: DUF2950 family protein [Acidobacteriota bacterium]